MLSARSSGRDFATFALCAADAHVDLADGIGCRQIAAGGNFPGTLVLRGGGDSGGDEPNRGLAGAGNHAADASDHADAFIASPLRRAPASSDVTPSAMSDVGADMDDITEVAVVGVTWPRRPTLTA